MDPLSATLAIVSLATAVRDIIEFGKKIHESFAEISKGHIVAQGLAEEIQEMLEDLGGFCEQNRGVLENLTDFRTELQDLLVKLKGFERRVLPLLPSQKTSRKPFFIRGWDSWRKSDAIETSIRELKDDIKKVVRRYMIKGVIRVEANTESIYHSTNRSLKVIEDIRREISGLRVSTAVTSALALTSPISCATSTVTAIESADQIITKFASTSSATSTPILRPPALINDEVISTAYVKFQVNTIVTLLEAVSKSLTAPNASAYQTIHHHESPLLLVLPEHSMTVVHLRRKTVRKVTDICDLLEMSMTTISVADALMALSQLSFYLGSLKMDDDAASISNWVVRLSRILLAQTDHPEAKADLARNLLNYSIDLQTVGDDYASLTAIEEAYAITHAQLQDANNIPTQTLILHCLILEQYALALLDSKVDSRRPLELVKQSVRIMESVLITSTGLHLYDAVGRIDLGLLGRLYGIASSKSLVVKYAQAQTVLAKVLAVDGQADEALMSMRLGLVLYRNISTHDAEITPQLATALYRIITGSISEMLSGEEQLDCASECTDLYRDLAYRNPKHYTRLLVNALWAKADFLRRMERHDESLQAWTEVVHMVKQLAHDDRLYTVALDNLSQQFRILDRYNDAASTRTLAITTLGGSTTEVQADRYLSLSVDLRFAGRNEEAVQATRTSLALYRILAVQDPSKWIEDVGVGLSAITECLVLVGDLNNALGAGRESVQILSNLLDAKQQQWPSDQLCNVLCTMRNIALLLDDDVKSMAILSEVMEHYSKLAEAFPQVERVEEDMLYCQHCYGVNLFRLGHLIEARRHFEQLLDIWMQRTPSCVSDTYIADRRLIALSAYVKILHAMGETNQTIVALHQAVITEPPYHNSEALGHNLYSIRLRVLFLIELGQDQEALKVAEEALTLARSFVDVDREDLVGSLHAVATAAILGQWYGRIVEVAEEAVVACQEDERLQPLSRLPENPICERVTNLPRSLKLLSFGIASLGRVEDGLRYAKEAVVRASELRTLPSLASSVSTQSYIEARGNLGNILVASRSFSEALEIFEERRRYFSERVEARNGEYRDLVPTLYVLGALYCNDGRHEHGLAVMEELQRIIARLKAVHPGLHEQIGLRLRHALMTPFLHVLNDMRNSLQCSHLEQVSDFLSI